jgi:transposase-like protein
MNLTVLHRKFNTQEKCIAYLEKIRWGNTPSCVNCGSTNVTHREGTIRWHCNDENKDFCVLFGTIFENCRLPLPKFCEIMFLMNNAKMGISASEISRAFGVKGHYKAIDEYL